MDKYVINGGNHLYGEVKIESAKNAVLPILASTVLTEDEVVIRDCPKISDVLNMIKILEHLGLFPSCLQSFPASVSFPMSQFFTSGDQSIGVSASASVRWLYWGWPFCILAACGSVLLWRFLTVGGVV